VRRHAVRRGVGPDEIAALTIRLRDNRTRLIMASRLVLLDSVDDRLLRSWTNPSPHADSAQSGAARLQEEALDIFRRFGDRRGEAGALNNLGIVLRQTGDHASTSQHLERALGIFRDIGDGPGIMEALCEVGALHLACGDPGPARDCYQEAMALSRQAANPRYEASALAGSARCALAQGGTATAANGLRQALVIFQRIGAPEADNIKAELDNLGSAWPPPDQI
jgi:tetratricopeptide (TPR) repeat protein